MKSSFRRYASGKRNASQSEKSLKPGSVVVNHAGLWILQPRFESVPGYTQYVSKPVFVMK